MPSYKIDEAIRLLPENNFNASQAMRQAGFTEASSRSGQQYERIRKRLAKVYSPEQIKADIQRYEKLFLKEKDYSNLARMVELRAKISGLGRESNTNIAIFSNADIAKGLPKIDITAKDIVDGQVNTVKVIDSIDTKAVTT